MAKRPAPPAEPKHITSFPPSPAGSGPNARSTLTERVPGILGPTLFRLEAAKPLNELAEVHLAGANFPAAAAACIVYACIVYRICCVTGWQNPPVLP